MAKDSLILYVKPEVAVVRAFDGIELEEATLVAVGQVRCAEDSIDSRACGGHLGGGGCGPSWVFVIDHVQHASMFGKEVGEVLALAVFIEVSTDHDLVAQF